MIHVINTLRANLLRKEIEGKIDKILSPPMTFHHDSAKLGEERILGRVSRMVQRLERVRRQRWAPWKDRK